MAINIKHYQSKNTWIKSNHTWMILKISVTRKFQLTIAINFISSRNTDDGSTVHSNSDNIEIMIYDKANEVI